MSKLAISFSRVCLFSVFFLLFCFAGFESAAQNSFSFLTIPNNARINAMGGVNVSLPGKDINFHVSNPALLDSSMQGQIGINYSPYLAQSNFLTLNYAPRFSKSSGKGQWGVSFHHLNYGTFQGTDAVGNPVGEFSANDFSLGISHARRVDNITFGITARLAGSVLESYNSMALFSDWGGTFNHPDHDLSVGIVAKNVGFVIKSYGNIRPEVPFDLQIGASFKPEHMPVRFSLTGHHLYIFDIAYNDPSLNYTFDEQGNKIPQKISVADKVLRHLVLGTEIMIHKNFYLMAGYNHLRQKELSLSSLAGAGGFSFGGNLRIKKFGFSFSRTTLVNGKGHFTFSLLWDSLRN